MCCVVTRLTLYFFSGPCGRHYADRLERTAQLIRWSIYGKENMEAAQCFFYKNAEGVRVEVVPRSIDGIIYAFDCVCFDVCVEQLPTLNTNSKLSVRVLITHATA